MTLRVVDGRCDEVTVSVRWPASTASLSRPPACSSSPATVSVRAVNDAGLAGPAALVPLNDTRPNKTERELDSASCVDDGARLCPRRSVDSRLCSVYELDGRVLIVNRTETTIAVQLVSSVDTPLHSRLTFVRKDSLPWTHFRT